MYNNLINIETGTLSFGNQEYIGPKTTYDEVQKMKGTIDHSFKNSERGIRIRSFQKNEMQGLSCQISIHFNFEKISMIFVTIEDGKQLLETTLWSHLKHVKLNKNTQKGNLSKRKNYTWGSIHAFYSPKVNLGQFYISYH